MEPHRISASEAYDRLNELDVDASQTICRRANDGIIIAKAKTLILANQRSENADVPANFWWARGNSALSQNWRSGDFETWIDGSFHWRAFGVTFLESDIADLMPTTSPRSPPVDVTPKVSTGNVAGRRRSENWTPWIAELVAYVHEVGLPAGEAAEGQDVIFEAIDARLIERDLDGLSRTTVQPVIRAVLMRLRQAGNSVSG